MKKWNGLVFMVWRYKWVFLLGLVVSFLGYQTFFSWEENDITSNEKTVLEENKTIFLVIEEHQYAVKKTGFDSLFENLKTWEYDKKTENVSLKFESWLPKENTRVMVIYDRKYDSFRRFNDVLTIADFPYKYYFNDTPLLTVSGIKKDGTVQLSFKGKRIEVSPKSHYPDWQLDGVQLSKITIRNYGIFDKNQFSLLQ